PLPPTLPPPPHLPPFPTRRSSDLRTRAVHGPRRREPGPIVTPIFASATWSLASARQGADFAVATAPVEYYTRWGNPTVRDLEDRSEEHTSELQSRVDLVCRLLLEK